MMKKLVFIPFIFLGLVVGLTGCLNSEDNNNRTTYSNVYSVVGYSEEINQPTINTIIDKRDKYGVNLIAIDLPSDAKEKGTCVLADFVIDYDNQPYKYLSAKINNVLQINQFPFVEDPDFDINELKDNMLPFKDIEYLFSSNQLGRIFYVTEVDTVPANQTLNYKLVYVPKPVVNDTINMYLYAEASGEPTGTKELRTATTAYNMNDLFKLGSDTTVQEIEVDFKRLYVNLQVLAGVNNTTGTPRWSTIDNSDKPFELFVPVNDLE